MGILKCLEALFCAAVTAWSGKYYLHMFQQEHYQFEGYLPWIVKHKEKILKTNGIFALAATALWYLLLLLLKAIHMESSIAAHIAVFVVVLAAYALCCFFTEKKLYSEPVKKPIGYTARMKRLIASLCGVSLVLSLVFRFVGIAPCLLMAVVPFLVYLAGLIVVPIEKSIYNALINDAKQILASRQDLIRIGITGSFGKTSVKFLLYNILSEKYDVLTTPGSENVPMSLTRLIREKLRPNHQIFLAEMGARNFGDIEELVDLVHPQYGVLTSVGAQHLEKFGSVENVAKAKYELIEGLPESGCAFFMADDGWCDRLYKKTTVEKYRAGLAVGYPDMYAKDIVSGPFGSRFVLTDGKGESIQCEMKLLGKHNVQNAALAACVARKLGLSMEEIARGLAKMEPVEHRLQLMSNPGGMTIIDDAFNSNPVGAKNALEVLASFPGRRIIVTPGMVEQGEFEAELNREFGRGIAKSCDEVILVGKSHVQPIAEGVLEGGFDKNLLHIVPNLSEAQKVLAQIGRPDAVVLFENDLTDNYSE